MPPLLTSFIRCALLAGLAGCALPLRSAPVHNLVFFGDSITAGYGLNDPSGDAFPALVQEKIKEAKLPWRVVNAGLSGETTAGGLRRVDWILRQPVDVFVLALGGNDGLRGIDPAVSKANLQAIIERVRAKNSETIIVLAGMMMPETLGPDYVKAFNGMYPELANKNGIPLIPFLLEGVGGIPRYNQPDLIHPTPEGHVIIARTMWKALEPLLKRASGT